MRTTPGVVSREHFFVYPLLPTSAAEHQNTAAVLLLVPLLSANNYLRSFLLPHSPKSWRSYRTARAQTVSPLQFSRCVWAILSICPLSGMKYYEAAVLHHSPGNRWCIISPNEDMIPPVPSEDGYSNSHHILEMYPDGSFGPHEYSTQPQIWDPTRPHLPWIPRKAEAVVGHFELDVLWRPLSDEEYTRLHPRSLFYRITDAFERQLMECLAPMKRLRERMMNDTSDEGRRIFNAIELARHCVIHIRFTDGHTLPALVDLVKGAKRQLLECLGHVLFDRYKRRVQGTKQPTDFATAIYEVVGLFTYDLNVVREHVNMDVPVWRIVEVNRLPPDFKIRCLVPLTRPAYPRGEKRLIAHVYGGDPYIAKLKVANPSQGLYIPIPGTGMFRFAGSVNTAGDITSVIAQPREDRQAAAQAIVQRTTQGGPDRTYPG